MNGDSLHPGSVAPDFSLPDQDGRIRTLSEYRGSWVFLYFYPYDDIAVCTKETCLLADHFQALDKLGVVVLGVSADSMANHKRFSEMHHLPFPLLSDVHRHAADRYEAVSAKISPGEEPEIMQISFLINVMGEIEKTYRHVKPETQAQQVIADLEKIRNEDKMLPE